MLEGGARGFRFRRQEGAFLAAQPREAPQVPGARVPLDAPTLSGHVQVHAP